MWAPRLGFEKCKRCNRTDRPHHAKGLCAICYDILLYPRRKELQHEKLKERWRRCKSKKKIDMKRRQRYNKEYYLKHKPSQTPDNVLLCGA